MGSISFAVPAAALAIALLAPMAEANHFSDYAWRYRPLVISVATPRSVDLEHQRKELSPFRAGMRERDLVVIEIIGNEVRTVLGQPTRATAQESCRTLEQSRLRTTEER